MSAPNSNTQFEMELYRLLERARLLPYYSTFIAQGGDDVSQLAEASEEEFNEILTLVGMARKVLHVRRLQKTLAEWKKDRAQFRRPLTNTPATTSTSGMDAALVNPFPGVAGLPGPVGDVRSGFNAPWPATTSYQHPKNFPSPQGITSTMNQANLSMPAFPEPSPSMASDGVPESMLPNMVLSPHQLEIITAATYDLVRVLPPYPAREVTGKKRLSRAINAILAMSPDDPKREGEIRQYSAIYGRSNSSRRTGRAMTVHELAVNEAAAQLCMRLPSLLTRRDDLFGLARQVVKMMEQNFHASTSSVVGGYEEAKGAPQIDKFPYGSFTRDDITNMQNRLRVLKGTMAELVTQHDDLRRTMKFSRADETVREIQIKLEALQNHQTRITNEQACLITQLRRCGASIPFPIDVTDPKSNECIQQEPVASVSSDKSVIPESTWDSPVSFSLESSSGSPFVQQGPEFSLANIEPEMSLANIDPEMSLANIEPEMSLANIELTSDRISDYTDEVFPGVLI